MYGMRSMIRCLERLQNGPIQKRKISSVYLLFHSVSGTCSSSDFYYHGRKRWCDLCSSYIYCVWNALYGSKFVIWFVVHGYDNQSGRYFSAYELENDGNKSQFSCSLGIVSSDYGSTVRWRIIYG